MISPSTVLIVTLALGVVSTLGAPYPQPEPQAIGRRYPAMPRDLFDPFQAVDARSYPEQKPKCPTNSLSSKKLWKSIYKSGSAHPTKSSSASNSTATSNAPSDPAITSGAPPNPPAPTSQSASTDAPGASILQPSQSAQLPAPSSGAAVPSVSSPPTPQPTDEVGEAPYNTISMEPRQEVDGIDLVDPEDIVLEGRGEKVVTAYLKL
ncbi:hypothetical protein BD779DRAFT_1496502, partial [Infundibulicybe gibba]